MTNEKKAVPTVMVNGQEVPVLTADLNSNQKLAIVSQNVLKALTKLLPKARFPEIKASFIEEVEKTAFMEEYVEVLQAELEFQMSVNILKEYFPERTTPTPVSKDVYSN